MKMNWGGCCMSDENDERLKVELERATNGCVVQGGWPCGTCFFDIDSSLSNQDWQNVLLIRGDGEDGLDNLPSDRQASYDKIIGLCVARDTSGFPK